MMENKNTKAEIIRNKIISTADDLFYRQGFSHTSFADIAKAVGISRGNFYYHFKSKDDILNAVLDTRKEGISAMLKQWSNEIPEAKDRLIAFVSMIATMQEDLIEFGCPIGTVCTELIKLQNINTHNATEMIALFRTWLVEQLQLLGCKAKQADQHAMHLLTCTQGISVIGHAFKDADYIQHEVEGLKIWIEQL